MIERTNHSPREDWKTQDQSVQNANRPALSLSQLAAPLLFLLIGVAWFSLDQLTGQMYQDQILPAYLIIGGLLLLRSNSK